MQADVVPLGFLAGVIGVHLFLKSTVNIFSVKSIGLFVLAALALMFVISIYQALIFIPIICYLIHFFQNTYQEEYNLKSEIGKGIYFGGLLLLSAVFYSVSVKIFCPPLEGGYLASYTSGDSSNRVSHFWNLWMDNLKGKAYYGEKLFSLCSVVSLFLIVKFGIEKRLFLYRFIALVLLMILPYFISFFITNGYYPPRIYVASGIVFAFILVHAVRNSKAEKIIVLLGSMICIAHLYFITQLFYSTNKIYNHDKDIARKIDFIIQSKYPQFDASVNYVYFYGCLPYEHHDRFRLPNSEVFGGSLFSWDNGSNHRIIDFFSYNDIAYYKIIDNKDVYLKIKDSINPMPIWPKPESIKMINNVIVVRLGKDKGEALWVE
jgi:hypothetical protein